MNALQQSFIGISIWRNPLPNRYRLVRLPWGLTEAADIGYTNLLSEDGHSVTRFLTHEPLTEDDLNLLNGSDLVIISRSVSSGHYDPPTDWNTKVTSPVIAMSGYILRSNRLNLTDGTTMVDTAEPLTLSADDPSHPVFDGVDIGNPFADIVTWDGTVQRGVSINMAELLEARSLPRQPKLPPAGGPVIAEWEAGATLNNGEILAGTTHGFRERQSRSGRRNLRDGWLL